MLNHVNTVLISTTAPATYTTVEALTEGAIALFDENRVLLKNATDAEKAKEVYVGVCEGKEVVYDAEGVAATKSIVRYTMPIKKGSKPSMIISKFVPSAEDIIVITATNINVEVGHRYVLRLVYNDVYEAPGQFAFPYEVIAKTTNVSDVIASFAKKINKHKGARVNAVANGNILTLTGKNKGDSEGLHPVNLYSQVSVEAFMWKTIPSGLLSNVPYPIANLTIAKTEGTPGRGNAKIVRDRENANLGYEGIQYRENAVYPYIAPALRVDLNAEYDTLTMEWDNLYLSNDNQYLKTTPLSAEIYVNKDQLVGTGEGTPDSTFLAALKAFLAKA